VGVNSISFNLQALITRDNEGETPIDIARRSGACAEIIGLLSLTPEEGHSLGFKGIYRLYAPVAYWRSEMGGWIQSRSWADCHKWINEHDDELVREVLKYLNSSLLRGIACESKIYSDSLMFLALRMIHRRPLSLTDPIRLTTRPSSMRGTLNLMRAMRSARSSASPPSTSPPPPSPPSSGNTSPNSSSTRRSSVSISPLAPSSST